MNTYTVFVIDPDQLGTTYITSVEADTTTEAKTLAINLCREDWSTDKEDPYDGDLHALGVAEGNVNILEWKDIHT